MATVVAENTKEAWEVKDPLCVWWCCVRAHVCIKVEELGLKDVVPGCEKAPLSCRQGRYSEEQTGCVSGAREPRINNTGPQRVRE